MAMATPESLSGPRGWGIARAYIWHIGVGTGGCLLAFVMERVISRMSFYGCPSLIAGGLCIKPGKVSFAVWEIDQTKLSRVDCLL
jgi:hypothetical protein